jgi:uncharacterized protein
MRIVALEEHFSIPALIRQIDRDAIVQRGFPVGRWQGPDAQLADLGPGRLRDMDQTGITVQVLSASGPGADLLDGAAGVALAREMNDVLAATIRENPDRFAGFAHLPMREPHAAAEELERAVRELGFCGAMINGMTQDCFLDHERFDPILARAEKLNAPIYLHPHLPPEAVRKAYFDGLPGNTGFLLAAPGWGWHSELALHVLRLVASGTLDRHPALQLIIGHMGEGLPAMMARCDQMFDGNISHLERSVSRTILDQVSVTTSGLFTRPPFDAALAVFGIDRVLFSVDYPYSSNQLGQNFLRALALPATDLEKLAHGNADRLLNLNTNYRGT